MDQNEFNSEETQVRLSRRHPASRTRTMMVISLTASQTRITAGSSLTASPIRTTMVSSHTASRTRITMVSSLTASPIRTTTVSSLTASRIRITAQQPYGQPNQNYYGQPAYQPVEMPPKGMATAALILGIFSMALFCTGFVAIILGVLAIIFGAISMKKLKTWNETHPNRRVERTTAIAGLITGIVGTVIALVITGLLIFGYSNIFRIMSDQMKNGKSYEDQLPEEFYDEFYGQFPELNNY